MKRIGTIGRELGRRLSEKLHIAYYDQEIIEEIAKRTAMSEEKEGMAILAHPEAYWGWGPCPAYGKLE